MASQEFHTSEIGFQAAGSLCLEKVIGVWGSKFIQEYNPVMTGLDRWIVWEKVSFLGKDAAQKDKEPKRKLCIFEIDMSHLEAAGHAPIRIGSEVVGMTTSGGYGHRVQKS